MIDEIKKEIENKTQFYDFNDREFRNIDTCNHITLEYISINKLFEILDKYSTQPDYKSAWGELQGDIKE